MAERRILPNRRPSITIQFEHGNIDYIASVGRFDDGSISEIFLRGGKTGSGTQAMAHDAAVAVSIGLQYGAPVNAIRKALLKLPDGSAAGPLGRALDLADAAGYGE